MIVTFFKENMHFQALLLMLVLVIQFMSYDDKKFFCNGEEGETTSQEADECIDPSGKFGLCIPLRKCKKLYMILKDNPLQGHRLKFLQRATCNFNGEEPWVCCESKNFTDGDEKEINNSAKNSTMEPPPPQKSVSVPSPAPISVNRFESHPNWRFLPSSKTCGNSLLSDRIIGGTDAGLGTYPWMALLAYLDPTGEIQYACGGTIVNARYILTASHCVTHLPEGFSVSFVRLGEYDRKRNPDCISGVCATKIQDIPVEEIVAHEKFDATGRTENDIALLRLKREISLGAFTTPVCLPTGDVVRHQLVKNNRTYVAGWGRFKLNSDVGSDILQHIYVPVQTTKDCNAYYSRQKIGAIDDTRFCAGGEQGKDSCQGDSGGPIMQTIFNEKTLQAQTWQFGIVSLGPSPCGSSNPALYTNVSHYIPWILDHLKQ